MPPPVPLANGRQSVECFAQDPAVDVRVDAGNRGGLVSDDFAGDGIADAACFKQGGRSVPETVEAKTGRQTSSATSFAFLVMTAFFNQPGFGQDLIELIGKPNARAVSPHGRERS